MNIRDKQFERGVYEEKRSSFEKNKKKTLKEIEDIKNNYEDQVKKITKEIEELYYKENQKVIENSNGKIESFKKRSR